MITQTNQAQFLDFEQNKVQTITLEQLKRTHEENDYNGEPLKGIHHYRLIEDIADMAGSHGMTTEVYDLFAAHNRDKYMPGVTLLPKLEEHYGKNAIEAHILRRVYANIRLKDYDTDEFTTNIAVSFTQRGITVGFGNMVRVCHNQCMLNADSIISTYGNREKNIDIDALKQTVESWLRDSERHILRERERIEKMRRTMIPAEQMYTIIGMLTARRVACDSSYEEIHQTGTYPLSQTQINQLTEMMMLTFKRKGEITVWDLYDTATNLYKADKMDMPNVLTQNRAMAEFILDQWDI